MSHCVYANLVWVKLISRKEVSKDSHNLDYISSAPAKIGKRLAVLTQNATSFITVVNCCQTFFHVTDIWAKIQDPKIRVLPLTSKGLRISSWILFRCVSNKNEWIGWYLFYANWTPFYQIKLILIWSEMKIVLFISLHMKYFTLNLKVWVSRYCIKRVWIPLGWGGHRSQISHFWGICFCHWAMGKKWAPLSFSTELHGVSESLMHSPWSVSTLATKYAGRLDWISNLVRITTYFRQK